MIKLSFYILSLSVLLRELLITYRWNQGLLARMHQHSHDKSSFYSQEKFVCFLQSPPKNKWPRRIDYASLDVSELKRELEILQTGRCP